LRPLEIVDPIPIFDFTLIRGVLNINDYILIPKKDMGWRPFAGGRPLWMTGKAAGSCSQLPMSLELI
jgi:hypothetical protein